MARGSGSSLPSRARTWNPITASASEKSVSVPRASSRPVYTCTRGERRRRLLRSTASERLVKERKLGHRRLTSTILGCRRVRGSSSPRCRVRDTKARRSE
eukprot:441049-Prymnesium_polylepis.1